jgi:hypothetical protein
MENIGLINPNKINFYNQNITRAQVPISPFFSISWTYIFFNYIIPILIVIILIIVLKLKYNENKYKTGRRGRS